MTADQSHVKPTTPGEYCTIFAGRQPPSSALAGVCGRVIRVGAGKRPEYLSYPETKRLAWVVGPNGLAAIVGRTGLQILLDLGTKPEGIQGNLAKNMLWVLAIFPEVRCAPATWEGLFGMVETHFPTGVGERLRRWADALAEGSTLLDAGQKARYGSPKVKEDPTHPDHMTPDRYLVGADTPENAWLFLWHSVGLNDLYTGTGFSRGDDGKRGHMEYLAPNVRVAELGEAELIELDVRGDALAAGWTIPAPLPEPR